MTRTYISLEHPLPEVCAGALTPPSGSEKFSMSIFIDASGPATKIHHRNWGALAVIHLSDESRCVERIVAAIKRRQPDAPRTEHGEIKGHDISDAVQGELWSVVKNSSKMQAIVLPMRPVDDVFEGNKKLGDLLNEASGKFSGFQPMAHTWTNLKAINCHKIQGILAPFLALVERPENHAIWPRLDTIHLHADHENFSPNDLQPLASLTKMVIFGALQKRGFDMPVGHQ